MSLRKALCAPLALATLLNPTFLQFAEAKNAPLPSLISEFEEGTRVCIAEVCKEFQPLVVKDTDVSDRVKYYVLSDEFALALRTQAIEALFNDTSNDGTIQQGEAYTDFLRANKKMETPVSSNMEDVVSQIVEMIDTRAEQIYQMLQTQVIGQAI